MPLLTPLLLPVLVYKFIHIGGITLKRNQPAKAFLAANPATTNPVDIFQPPVNTRIREITELTATGRLSVCILN
jgi:hypothetical protein